MPVQLANISVFYKQRGNLFYPVTSFSLPTILLRIPLSAICAMLWTLMTYFVVGFAPDPGRQSPCSPTSKNIAVYMKGTRAQRKALITPLCARHACRCSQSRPPVGVVLQSMSMHKTTGQSMALIIPQCTRRTRCSQGMPHTERVLQIV